jgi:hypothetical protein
MDSTSLIKLFRADVNDTLKPYLWTDPELLSYLDDAQKMFARLTGGISDASSDVTRLEGLAGEAFVTISPRILKIRQVQRVSDARDLDILNFEDLQNTLAVDDYGFQQGFKLDNQQGEVRAVISGMEQGKLRLLRIPEADVSLQMIVYRMPLKDIVDFDQKLEIEEQHHRHLMLWMRALGHQKPDAETYDRTMAQAYEAKFYGYCDQAKAERERKEHKYRTVAYGGI